jgi:replicative DNA helicase
MTDTTTIPAELLMSKADEAATLGRMFIDSGKIPAVLEWVTRETFAFPEHQAVFDAILKVWRRNPSGALDGVLLRSELEQTRALEDVGGLDYLREIVESTPPAANGVYYARQVEDRQRNRANVAAVEQMREVLLAGGSAAEIAEKIQALAMALQSRPREQNIYHVKDHATTVAVQTQDEPCIVASGYQNIDRLVGGVCPGDAAYLAARTSMGKTTIACGWTLNAARAGKHVAFFTLEMTARALMERLSAMLGHVSLATVKRPRPAQNILDAFYEGTLLLSKLPITIIENAPTVEQMTATLRQLKQTGPVDLVCIDYVGLMAATHSRNRNRDEQLTEISRDLKRMAQGEHVPLIVLAQLNRECEGRENHRPRMSDLRDSGAQEQDADPVILLHREDYYRKMADSQTKDIDGLAEVIIAKARNGPTGMAQLVFFEEEMRFVDLAHGGTEGE